MFWFISSANNIKGKRDIKFSVVRGVFGSRLIAPFFQIKEKQSRVSYYGFNMTDQYYS